MSLQVVANYACRCGESPLWHPLEKRLYWVDNVTDRMFRYDPATGGHEQVHHGRKVAAMTAQADGSLLLFMDRGGIGVWRDGRIVRMIVEEIADERSTRFNDVIADPLGRVFCGTMPAKDHPARLYRLDLDGSLTVLLDDVGMANGMGFSPDLRHLYFTDTPAQRIWRFDYNPSDGSLSHRFGLIQVPGSEGHPDGLTVDAQGNLWSAHWGGSRLTQYSPDGRKLQHVEFPTPKITSCAFGGPDFADLYVTSAGGEDPAHNGPDAGALFRCRSGVAGRREFLSRVGI